MRSLIQRVKEAKVLVNNNIVGEINKGLLVFLGIGNDDNEEDINWLSQKIIQLRIFSDEEGKLNKNIQDINGSLLIVSQFTLFASTKKGNRPSFINSAPPEKAKTLYEQFIEKCECLLQKKVEQGIFGANMNVYLINDGPVTIWIDTKNKE